MKQLSVRQREKSLNRSTPLKKAGEREREIERERESKKNVNSLREWKKKEYE
jgi:hypothetical protein